MQSSKGNNNLHTYATENASISHKVGDKSNSSWKMRRNLQKVHIATIDTNVSHTESSNVPHIYKGTHDRKHPSFGYIQSDLKDEFMEKEVFQSKLIAPAIQIKLPKV